MLVSYLEPYLHFSAIGKTLWKPSIAALIEWFEWKKSLLRAKKCVWPEKAVPQKYCETSAIKFGAIVPSCVCRFVYATCKSSILQSWQPSKKRTKGPTDPRSWRGPRHVNLKLKLKRSDFTFLTKISLREHSIECVIIFTNLR